MVLRVCTICRQRHRHNCYYHVFFSSFHVPSLCHVNELCCLCSKLSYLLISSISPPSLFTLLNHSDLSPTVALAISFDCGIPSFRWLHIKGKMSSVVTRVPIANPHCFHDPYSSPCHPGTSPQPGSNHGDHSLTV